MNKLMVNEKNEFDEVASIIETRKRNAYIKVNEELINMYWDVGKYVSEKVNNSLWGSKTVENLANYIKMKYPNLSGFDRRGIYRMKQFYEMYCDDEIVSPLVTQISWSNNLIIMSRTKSTEEREFYIKMCIKNHYKKRELDRQISSAYYERYMLSSNKANESITSTVDEDDYPNTKLLDTYSLEFLDLPNEFKEKDLKEALIHNMKDFILEIGKFKPEYISKMNFYLEALDRQVKQKDENPSVGIILCSSKNDEVVEYSMSRSLSPTMISNYTLKLPDKKILEKKLKEIKQLLDNDTINN